MDAVRDIANARNAIIHAGANHAVQTRINRSAKDRSQIFFSLDSTVQIVHKHRRVGAFRALAHLRRNRVLGGSGYAFKWRKFKTRLVGESSGWRMGEMVFPKNLKRSGNPAEEPKLPGNLFGGNTGMSVHRAKKQKTRNQAGRSGGYRG